MNKGLNLNGEYLTSNQLVKMLRKNFKENSIQRHIISNCTIKLTTPKQIVIGRVLADKPRLIPMWLWKWLNIGVDVIEEVPTRGSTWTQCSFI